MLVINCCTNCVETFRSQEWGARFIVFLASWSCVMAGVFFIKAGDVETIYIVVCNNWIS